MSSETVRVGPPTRRGYRQVKRATRACQHCHSRKVRCDGEKTGMPCSNCRFDGKLCQVFLGGRTSRKQLTLSRSRPEAMRATQSRVETPRSHASLSRSPSPCVRWAPDGASLPLPYFKFLERPVLDELNPVERSILETQGCLHFPKKTELGVFFHHYFLYVHPLLPLLDEASFWTVYQRPLEGAPKLPVLLVRAMLFSASCFVPTEVLHQCGYESPIAARDDLYQKAKLVYEAGIEKCPLTIARASLLLTYCNSDSDVLANSVWLRIAISQARREQARQDRCSDSLTLRERADLNLVWWCCLIRDRLISLGMRRPLQITIAEFNRRRRGMAADDLKDEIFNSKVYHWETKSALFHLLASLCRFAIAVTELITFIYPSCEDAGRVRDIYAEIDRLEAARSPLILWELDWITFLEGKNSELHTSISLFSSLVAIYYHSSRVALCNRLCYLLGSSAVLDPSLCQFESCRSDLITAVRSIADKVKQLSILQLVDKLPISAVAYTTTTEILLTIDLQDTQKASTAPFKELNESLRLRYPIARVSNLIARALWLSQVFKHAAEGNSNKSHSGSSAQSISGPGYHQSLFGLSLQQYNTLLHYVDQSMSIPRGSVQETEILYATASSWKSWLPHDTAESDLSAGQEGEPDPVWMEALGNYFFGPGEHLYLSPSAVLTSETEGLGASPVDDGAVDVGDSSSLSPGTQDYISLPCSFSPGAGSRLLFAHV
ncbi:hypothetical protein BJY00DRAFT_293874 [Aspergillus carlsbadensis]|nr:hypothetical protein BJY00DRAFT_293874 [Aspergillus carlsbadensis]